MRRTWAALVLLIVVEPSNAEEIQVMSWCREGASDEATNYIAKASRAPLWAITRVPNRIITIDIASLGMQGRDHHETATVQGTARDELRTCLVYDAELLTVKRHWELSEIALGTRAPLVVEFAIQKFHFLVVACDFARSHTPTRRAQALFVGEWVRKQGKPAIVVGAIQPRAADSCDALAMFQREHIRVAGHNAKEGPDAILVGPRTPVRASPVPYWKGAEARFKRLREEAKLRHLPVTVSFRLDPPRDPAVAELRGQMARAKKLAAQLGDKALSKELSGEIDRILARLDSASSR